MKSPLILFLQIKTDRLYDIWASYWHLKYFKTKNWKYWILGSIICISFSTDKDKKISLL